MTLSFCGKYKLLLSMSAYRSQNLLVNACSICNLSPSLSSVFDIICRQGCDVSVKDLDCLLSQLAEKKRKMEQEEAETNLQVLLEFLVCLRKRKLEELSQVCLTKFKISCIVNYFFSCKS